MTTEATETGESFAAFEARVMAGEPETPDNEEKPDNPETNDELELTEDDELAPDEDGDEDKGEKKPRHKSAKDRIAELTREKHEERRRNAELEQRLAALEGKPDKPANVNETGEFKFNEPEPDPNDAKYEFGEADSQYLKDLARYEGRKAYAEAAHEAGIKAKADEETAQRVAIVQNLDTAWAEKAAKGSEKYEDFDEVVTQGAAESKWLCPPIVAAGISGSEVGDDVAYHLAKNPGEAAALAANVAAGNIIQAAEAFGAIEGRFLDKMPEMPTTNDPLALAVYAGQLRAFASRGPVEEKPKGKTMTDAPEPARHTARGSSGKFGVDDDTTDFRAFEKKIMGRRG